MKCDESACRKLELSTVVGVSFSRQSSWPSLAFRTAHVPKEILSLRTPPSISLRFCYFCVWFHACQQIARYLVIYLNAQSEDRRFNLSHPNLRKTNTTKCIYHLWNWYERYTKREYLIFTESIWIKRWINFWFIGCFISDEYSMPAGCGLMCHCQDNIRTHAYINRMRPLVHNTNSDTVYICMTYITTNSAIQMSFMIT